MGKAKKLARRLLPYWLGGGDRTCSGCGRRHAHSVAAHCVACDLAHCPLCIVVVEGEVFCTGCHGEGGS